MNNRTTILFASIVVAAGIIGGTLIVTRNSSGVSEIGNKGTGGATAVSMEGGTQIIEVTAKGGYYPNLISAQAEVPTILRMRTKSTLDCSAAFVIPSLGFRKTLPPTGMTEFTIPAQKKGSVLQGLCGMGMYSLTIQFK